MLKRLRRRGSDGCLVCRESASGGRVHSPGGAPTPLMRCFIAQRDANGSLARKCFYIADIPKRAGTP